MTADTCSTLGTNIDGAVRRIETVYEVRGLVEQIRSYDAQSTLVSDVLLEYNAFGQVLNDYQEHAGAVNTSTTPKVGYVYSDGTMNQVRRTQTVYPNGRILHVGYSSGNDDALSRVSYLADDNGSGSPGQHLVEYSYLGTGSVVRVAYLQPNIHWGLMGGSGGAPQGLDPYGRIDRFGRVVDQIWRNCTTATNLVRIGHGYDRAGNRLWRQDMVAASANLDELYSYDGMNQLVALQRGRLNSTFDGLQTGTKTFGEGWSLDMTGNWTTFQQDTDGNGTWDLNQSRTHNAVNEILTASTWATPAHDRAGNMTTVPKPGAPSSAFTCTYDAWNRLVRVVDASTSNTVAEYAYDGRNFRIVKKTYTSGTLSEIRHSYYNEDWQELEQRIADPIPNPQSLIPVAQFIWGARYIDDLVLRDRDADSSDSTGNLGQTGSGLEERLYALQDANWNVVAITNASGTVQERYVYTAYGTPTFLDASFANPSASSSYAWETLYTGRYHDCETRDYYCRHRPYGAMLGRFHGRDPVEAEDHPYRYVKNRPLDLTDPSGTITVTGVSGGRSLDNVKCGDTVHYRWQFHLAERATSDGFIVQRVEVLCRVDDCADRCCKSSDTYQRTVYWEAWSVGKGRRGGVTDNAIFPAGDGKIQMQQG